MNQTSLFSLDRHNLQTDRLKKVLPIFMKKFQLFVFDRDVLEGINLIVRKGDCQKLIDSEDNIILSVFKLCIFVFRSNVCFSTSC